MGKNYSGPYRREWTAPDAKTPLQYLSEYLDGYAEVIFAEDEQIEEIAAKCDAALYMTTVVEGEGMDRSDIRLPGVTRKSCLELLKSKGYNVSERLLSIDELEAAMDNGTLEEAWGCGTAAVISPIGKLAYKDKVISINDGKIGEVTQMLYDTLTGIQWGKIEDSFGWIYKL